MLRAIFASSLRSFGALSMSAYCSSRQIADACFNRSHSIAIAYTHRLSPLSASSDLRNDLDKKCKVKQLRNSSLDRCFAFPGLSKPTTPQRSSRTLLISPVSEIRTVSSFARASSSFIAHRIDFSQAQDEGQPQQR